MCFLNYSYAVGIHGTIIVCLLTAHPSICLSITDNRCIVEKRWVNKENFFSQIISSVSMLSAYKISEMQCKGNIFKLGVE